MTEMGGESPVKRINAFLSEPITYSHALLNQFYHELVRSGVKQVVFEGTPVRVSGAVDEFFRDLERVREIHREPSVLNVEPDAIEIGLPWTDLRGLSLVERHEAMDIAKVYRAESEIPQRNVGVKVEPLGFRPIK